MVEIVAGQVSDRRAERASTHEGVGVHVLVEVHEHVRHARVPRVVLADDAGARGGVVGLADPGEQEEMRVGPGERRQQDDLRRLLDLAPLPVDVRDADRPTVFHIDPGHVREGPDLVVPGLERGRQHGGLRRRLRRHFACVVHTEATIEAGAHREAIRVRVRSAHLRRRRWERAIAKILARLRVECLAVAARQRRVRELALPRPLERVSTGSDRASDVAGGAGDAARVLELVVERLELVVRDRPVLNRALLRNSPSTVPLDDRRPDLEVPGRVSPGPPRPVETGAADALAPRKRAVPAHGARLLAVVVPEREGGLARRLEELELFVVPELIVHLRQREVGLGPIAAALESHDLETGLGEFLPQDAPRPADTNGDYVNGLQLRRHSALLGLAVARAVSSGGPATPKGRFIPRGGRRPAVDSVAPPYMKSVVCGRPSLARSVGFGGVGGAVVRGTSPAAACR